MLALKIFEQLCLSSKILVIVLFLFGAMVGFLEIYFIFHSVNFFAHVNTTEAISSELILFLGLLFAILTLCRILLVIFKSGGIHYVGYKFAIDIIEKYFRRNFLPLKNSNFDELTSTLLNKVNQSVRGIFLPCLNMVVLFVMAVSAAIIFYNDISETVIFTLCIVGLFYLALLLMIRKSVNSLSKNLNILQTSIVQTIGNVKSGLREILVKNLTLPVIQNLDKQQFEYRKALAIVQIFNELPRYLLELTVVLALLLVLIFDDKNLNGSHLSFFFASALAASRIIPALQQAFVGWNTYKSNCQSATQVINDFIDLKKNLQLESKSSPTLVDSFSSISLRQVTFGATMNKKIVNEEIKKGDKVVITGTSGAGKTTFLDILSGLRKPDSGMIQIDGEEVTLYENHSWKNLVHYVGQNVFSIPNLNLMENITLSTLTGVKLQDKKYQNSLKYAELLSVSKKNDVDIKNLSGGELQRISIARIYLEKKSLILLDEPTSSLDDKTASKLIDQLLKIFCNQTVICVSHDPKIVSKFSRKISL
jgi:ATP-binding cassette, subfamily B, bacterial PglK